MSMLAERARSGGVDGRAWGIHADHLRPVKRVLRAFAEEVVRDAGNGAPTPLLLTS